MIAWESMIEAKGKEHIFVWKVDEMRRGGGISEKWKSIKIQQESIYDLRMILFWPRFFSSKNPRWIINRTKELCRFYIWNIFHYP